MIAHIQKSALSGAVPIPSSKSATHRAIIGAALSRGTSVITGVSVSDDITATADALRSMGAVIEQEGDTFTVHGITKPSKACTIDCKESGSTVRFLIPVAAALGIEATFIGQGRLPQRPLTPITQLLREHGVSCGDTLPLTLHGKLQPGHFTISGDVSSQFVTGLIYAMCLHEQPSEIELSTPLQSAGYVDMTVQMCETFGCRIDKTDKGYAVKGVGQATDLTVEGDYSQAAFYLEAAALGADIELHGLSKTSLQGDKACLDLFEQMGCTVQRGDVIRAFPQTIRSMDIDVSQVPDLVPALAATLAFADGTSRIYNAARLRLKESDRLDAVAQNLEKMGIRVDQTPDSITIHGGQPHGAQLQGFGDHRIVMAFAMAGAKVGNTTIDDAEAIGKSYPAFFDHFQSLGGVCHVL